MFPNFPFTEFFHFVSISQKLLQLSLLITTMVSAEITNEAPNFFSVTKAGSNDGANSPLEAILSEDDTKRRPDHALVDPEVAKYASQRAIPIDEATNKRLKRLIDRRILAVMVGKYFLQALDKGTISFVAIMGIREDTHLVGQQASTQSERTKLCNF